MAVKTQYILENSPGHFATQWGVTTERAQALRFDTAEAAQTWLQQWPGLNKKAAIVPVEIKEESGRFAGLQSDYNPFSFDQ